ncbi:MAG TPA: phosphodiester glycosidase family protein [Candidatus Saccharimonadales bacterium]|nr:phosphodiester glycosidase family protein [Candidatus Saccharimonadales bacterium]
MKITSSSVPSKKVQVHRLRTELLIKVLLLLVTLSLFSFFFYYLHYVSVTNTAMKQQQTQFGSLQNKHTKLQKDYTQVQKQLQDLQNQDQVKINKQNLEVIKHIETTYKEVVSNYENLLDLKVNVKNTKTMDDLFTTSMSQLSEKNYASAEATLSQLAKTIQDEQAKLAAANAPATGPSTQNVPVNNTAPSGGYSRQSVSTDKGTFVVDIISGDMGSTRIIVDTASDSDCRDNCPVLSLGDYVARNGAYAGINGSYFCPASYPSCAGKTNSFDLLVMNKNKHYFNSDNNVYSSNPAVIFGNGYIRFVGSASGWGRDTSVDGVLSNYPLLVSGNSVTYSDSPDPKFNSKGPRDFVANKGNTAYIGSVYNATMGESALVLKTLGMDNAMNLDEGGSTALWYGGYKAGPGRAIPNAILFIRK